MLRLVLPQTVLLAALILLCPHVASAQTSDVDLDGVANSVDNCVGVANADQNDSDNDGRGDACECGDFTGDGFVNSVDARLVQRCAIGVIPCPDLCDVTGEGECNSVDARLIQRFSVGQLTKENLVCEFPLPPVPFEGVLCASEAPDAECTIDVRGLELVTTRDKITLDPGGGAGAQASVTGADGLSFPGIIIEDNLRLPTPVGELVLLEALVQIAVGPSGIGPFQTMVGTARVPFPDIGFMAGVVVDETPMATLGLDLGSNLGDLGVPLIPDRQFLFFDFSGNFAASLGPVSFDAGGPSATAILDPLDPFFYVGGSLGGLLPESDPPPGEGGEGEGGGGPDDLGFGISISGLIPFVPETTAGIEGDVGLFFGHLLVKAPIPFAPLPLTLDGLTIADIDPDDNGTIFVLSPDLQLGGNGTLSVGIPFLSFFEFGFDLGTSSAGVLLSESDISAFFSGVLDPDDPFAMFPPSFPIPIKQSPQQVGATVAGFFSGANLASSFVRAEGEFSIDLGPLGDPIGVNLGELAGSEVFLGLDAGGLEFRGRTSSQIIPDLTNAEMSLEVFIPASDLLGSSAELAGAITIAGAGLDPARLFISPRSGFEVEGNLDLSPIATLLVVGGIDGSGVMLTGQFDAGVTFDLEPAVLDSIAFLQDGVDLAQGEVDRINRLIDDCIDDVCGGDCYLNPCCLTICEAPLETIKLAALAALFAAEQALNVGQAAANEFFNLLPIPIRGTIDANVDVTIDNDVRGSVSASFFGLALGGRAALLPPAGPKVCVTIPLGDFPGGGALGLGDEEFCLPPI